MQATAAAVKSDNDQYDFLNTASTSTSSVNLDTTTDESTKSQLLGSGDAKRLSELLTTMSLPRVQGTEQMYLLAVIDTFVQMQETQGAMDACGLKFLLSFKIFTFLRRTLPPAERPTSLTSTDFIWALHSEAEDSLIQTCLPAESNWSVARSLGIGVWLRKPSTLKALIERIAKAQFTATKDPHDCMLFYLALNKKAALVALFKAVKNMPVHDFLKNDFTQEKWKTAAMKNAYVLLGKQKFEIAAAFFLLGGQLKDCVDICIKKLADHQLALLVARLVEGDGPHPIFDYIVTSHLLPLAKENNDQSLISISFWLLKRYSDSVSALLDSSSSSSSSFNSAPATEKEQINHYDPSLLHLFKFLRSHTMLRDSTLKFEDIHFDLVKKTAHVYIDSGYTLLAVDQVKWLLDTVAEKKKKASSAVKPTFSKRFMFDAPPPSPKQEEQSIDKSLAFKVAMQLLTQVKGMHFTSCNLC